MSSFSLLASQRPSTAALTCRVNVQRRSVVVTVRAAAQDGRDPTGLSSLRFAKPSLADIQQLANEVFNKWVKLCQC